MYVANDGTEFHSEEECKKYEESAKGVVSARYRELIVRKDVEENILGFGCSDDTVEIVMVKTEADYDTVLQMKLLIEPYLTEEQYAGNLDIAKKKIRRALDEQDVLIVNRGCCCGDIFWLMGTRNSFKESIDKFCDAEKQVDNA